MGEKVNLNIDQLHSELETKKARKLEIGKELTKLTQTRDKEDAEKENTIMLLKVDYHEINIEINRIEKKINLANAIIDRDNILKKIEKFKKENGVKDKDSLSEEIETLDSSIKSQEDRVNEINKKIKELEDKAVDLSIRMSDRNNKNNDELRQQYTQFTAERMKLKRELGPLTSRLEQNRQAFKGLKGLANELSENYQTIKGLSNELGYDIDDIEVEPTRDGGNKPNPDEPNKPNQGGKPNPDEPNKPNQGGKPNPDEPNKPNQGGKPNPDEPNKPNQGGKPNPDEPNKPNQGGKPNPSNLPLKSGLQVYRALLNEIGPIKGTKAIAAHDFINKFNFLGINKLVAWGIRKATGRKGEVERIIQSLNDLPREDFNLMMDDFLLKDNDIRGIIDHKVNEILLEAIEKKCERDFIVADPSLSDKEVQTIDEFQKTQQSFLAAKAKGEDTTALEAQLVTLGAQKSHIHRLRERLESRSRKVRDGREAKSYDRKNNIRGGLRAVRNPDNREEINGLADLELKVLQARRDGDKVAESQGLAQMEKYRASQTEYITRRNGKIMASIGAFDSDKGEVKVISNQKNIAPELLGSISLIAASAGVAYLSALQQQQAIQGQAGSPTINVPNVSDKTVQAAQDSLDSDVIDIQALSERASSLGSGFDHSSQTYATLDQAGVARASDAFNNIQNFNTGKGSNLEKLAEIFAKKAEIAGAHQEAMNKVADGAAAFYRNGHNVMSSLNIDHGITSAVEQHAATYAGANAQLYSDMAKILEGFKGMGSQALQQQVTSNPDLLPIIIASIPGVYKSGQEVAKAREARREADSELEPYDDGRD